MKKMRFALLIAVLLGLFVATSVLAQNEELKLSFSRDFGYSSGTGDIQGLFSMKVSGTADLARIGFYIDDTKIGEDTEAPFRLQFNTDDYPLGVHKMYAVGYSADGREYHSKVVTANFVAASEGTAAAMKIAIPMLVIVGVAILLATGVPILMGRKTAQLAPGTPRQYPLGGTICSKCGRPFAMHLYGLNLGLSKFDRCPYCSKWSVVKFISIEKLHAAEQAELEGAQAQVPEEAEEEKLKKELNDSKYQGL